MSERLMLEGSLEKKKKASLKLAAVAEGLIRSLKMLIQPASVIKLTELKTDQALELAEQLHETREKYLQLKAEIADIEKELL